MWAIRTSNLHTRHHLKSLNHLTDGSNSAPSSPNHYIDIAVKNVSGKNITVENPGGFAIPFDISILYTDDSKETLHQNPAIWEKNEKTAVVILKGKKPIRQITLDEGIFMDATPLNNKWSAK